MKAEILDYGTGWYGLALGMKEKDIDRVITALQEMKKCKSHFHLRSDFDQNRGVGDLEFYYQDDDDSDNVVLDVRVTPS